MLANIVLTCTYKMLPKENDVVCILPYIPPPALSWISRKHG